MLVRFLSFVASVLGTARYKAIILSCLALVFSLTGIAVMTSWHNRANSNAASQVEQSESKNDQQQGSPQLGEEQKQAIQNEQPQQNTNDNKEQNTTEQPSGNPNTPAKNEQTAADIITVSTASLTLAAGSTSSPITATVASTASTGNLTTEVIDNNESIFVEQQETVTGGIRFVIRASADIVKKDQPYEVIVVVKDASQKIVDSQAITVTIQ
jgi:predicted peptidase